jgi:hypothetical protein
MSVPTGGKGVGVEVGKGVGVEVGKAVGVEVGKVVGVGDILASGPHECNSNASIARKTGSKLLTRSRFSDIAHLLSQ